MWCDRAGVKLLSQLRTSKKLGWRNCVAVAAHRVALNTGFYQRRSSINRCPVPEALAGRSKRLTFTSEPWFVASREACLAGADALLAGCATWFSNEEYEIGSPPDWLLDPASGQHFPDGSQHWSRCQPFAAIDIKRCWELSRWAWAPLRACLAVQWRQPLHRWAECLDPELVPVQSRERRLQLALRLEASIRLLHAFQAWQLSDAPGRPQFSP